MGQGILHATGAGFCNPGLFVRPRCTFDVSGAGLRVSGCQRTPRVVEPAVCQHFRAEESAAGFKGFENYR